MYRCRDRADCEGCGPPRRPSCCAAHLQALKVGVVDDGEEKSQPSLYSAVRKYALSDQPGLSDIQNKPNDTRWAGRESLLDIDELIA